MKRIINIVAIIILSHSICAASNIEGTNTYKDYLFILVHGMNGGSHHFNGQDERDSGLRLKQHLEDDLGLKGYVYAYSFKNKNGSSLMSVREFGDRTYDNPASYKNDNGNYISMQGKCWLEKARDDFKVWFKAEGPGKAENRGPREDEIPSKYIVLTHSMGNMPVRLYIYSKQVLGKSLYGKDLDIAKVVFIAPPFTGSDLAYVGMVPAGLFWDYQTYTKGKFWWDMMNSLYSDPASFLVSPYRTYDLAKEYSYLALNSPLMMDNVLKGQLGITDGSIKGGGSLLSGTGYCAFDLGLYELMPDFMMLSFPGLMDAKLDDDTKEPAYSVFYGSGSPIFNLRDTVAAQLLTKGVRYAADEMSRERMTKSFEELTKNMAIGNFSAQIPVDTFAAFNNEIFMNGGSLYGQFNNELLTFIGSSAFSKLPTAQAKFLALVQSNPYLVFSDDGDSAVPVESALGHYQGKTTRAVRNAKYYKKVFTCGFNDYLEHDFPALLAGAYSAYGLLVFTGTPSDVAATVCQWFVLLEYITKVNEYAGALQDTSWTHTNGMLKQYDIIENAVLDTPAIFTVTDLQTSSTSEVDGTPEATMKGFSSGVTIPTGYMSIKVRSLTENRNVSGFTSMPVPMTLRALTATGEGERKYATILTVTKPPQRIVGKLNYLVPKLMKSFEYSFNFAAWKPIAGVDPETGEFVLDGLEFAEG